MFLFHLHAGSIINKAVDVFSKIFFHIIHHLREKNSNTYLVGCNQYAAMIKYVKPTSLKVTTNLDNMFVNQLIIYINWKRLTLSTEEWQKKSVIIISLNDSLYNTLKLNGVQKLYFLSNSSILSTTYVLFFTSTASCAVITMEVCFKRRPWS